MRAFLAAVVVALVVSAMSRADLLPPGTKNIPVEHKIESEKEYPDWVFFIVRGSGGVKKVTLSPKSAIVIPGSSAVGRGPVPKPGQKEKGSGAALSGQRRGGDPRRASQGVQDREGTERGH